MGKQYERKEDMNIVMKKRKKTDSEEVLVANVCVFFFLERIEKGEMIKGKGKKEK